MIDDYELIQPINSEHKVFLIKNIIDNTFYVKKILDIYDIAVYRFLAENHFDGIPQIKELIEEDGRLTLIEEYVEGLDLEATIRLGKRYNDQEVKTIAIKLCTILKNLNSKAAIVHRDIKPSNIILKNDGSLCLLDFNTAKFIDPCKPRDTILLGTEGYAAPEQYGFASSNIQTDIYAIGVLMKELLTGTNVADDHYLSKLNNVIKRCTRLDPSDRYQNYEQLIEDLTMIGKINFKKYAPVGFRSDKIWIKIIAVLWYLLILSFAFHMGVENTTGFNLLFNRMGFASAFITMTLFAGNYLHCQEKTGISRIRNKLIKVVIISILDILLGLSIIIFTLILDSFIK